MKKSVFLISCAAATAHADSKAPVAADVSLGSAYPDAELVVGKDELTVAASTTLCEKKPKLCHGPELLVDDDAKTAWCEGLPGDGAGATITFTFKKAETLEGFQFLSHFAKSFALAEQNARPESLTIDTDAGQFTADLEDAVPKVKKENGVHEVHDPCGCGDETCMSRDERISTDGVANYVTFPSKVKTKTIVLTLKSAYKGTKYKDTCASSISFVRAK
ncbi:MAG TPA: hypothetical protein VL463_31405 [Kofleriaceae bacterium]|nr:hypothetical protein [Kofleriaceae bacterium]